MEHRPTRAFLVILGCLAMPRSASAEMYDAEYRGCAGDSSIATVECLTRKTAAWDASLNANYSAALRQVDLQQRDPLRQAQRLWIQYRDANCRFYGMREGSLRQIQAAECLRSMTADRSRELKDLGNN